MGYRTPYIRVMTEEVGTRRWFDVVHFSPVNRKQRRRARDLVETMRAIGLHAAMKIEDPDA